MDRAEAKFIHISHFCSDLWCKQRENGRIEYEKLTAAEYAKASPGANVEETRS